MPGKKGKARPKTGMNEGRKEGGCEMRVVWGLKEAVLRDLMPPD